MRLRNSILWTLLIFGFSKAFSQEFKQFSGKKEDFKNEVLKFTKATKDPELIDTYKEFALNWDSARFSDPQKENIILLANCLMDKKVRSNPDFMSYLSILNLFISTKHNSLSFDQWLKGMYDACSPKKSSLALSLRLIETTRKLLSGNMLYQSPSLSWVLACNNFRFDVTNDFKVVCDSSNLVCYAKRDSINIYRTSGVFILKTNVWKGKNGFVTWERAGYSRDTINARLIRYSIDLTKSSYEADSVWFINKTYFDSPLQGHLEDNVTHIIAKKNAAYPKFDSYQKHFKIHNLYENVNYEGGFSMQGAKLVGSGNRLEPARLDFFRKDSLKLTTTSLYFIFRPEKVIGVDAAVTIYLDKDSIFHGDLQFNYTVGSKEISLLKSENYTAQSPYMNTYHKVDMNFEQLQWKIDEPVIYITNTPGSSIGKAKFESLSFFNMNEFEQLQYYDEVHPLVALKQFAKKMGYTTFSAQDFANYINRTMDQTRTLLFPLSIKGYIFYDSSRDWVEIKDRLYDNLNASIGKIDYDVLRFISSTNAPLENGSIDLRNNDMKINGIPKIFVSDSQSVVIYPKNQSITMKSNRSFQFDGVVQAGLFTFKGRNFFFDYDEFKLGLNDIDSIEIKVIVGYDNFGKPILREVNNVIQDVTGNVLIDDPGNKSGLKKHPEYPIFTSNENSFVYYEKPEVFNNVYKRKTFYFEIYPYKIDSLDNFRKEQMRFKGQLVSANIFPNIPENLVLQEDFSLGFNHKTSATGLPAYGGKGQYYNGVNLSNRGLKGDGRLTYLTSTTFSGSFYFFPDSMNSFAPEFIMTASTKGRGFPYVRGENIYVHWVPYKDELNVKNEGKPFQIYNENITLMGSIVLKPNGLTGKGTMDLKTAVTSSKMFEYSHNSFTSDTADFKLRSVHNDQFTVLTNNVQLHIDWKSRIGAFRSNDETSITQFPENKYIASLEEFRWKMDKKELDMTSKQKNPAPVVGNKYGFKDEALLGAKYISVKKGQDSLSFISPLATYDYMNNILKAQKVKYIEVADARIFPYKENVVIEADAKMQTLLNSTIMANTQTRFHEIYKSTVDIQGKYSYKGTGKYNYVDENNKVDTITFTEIGVDTTLQTYAMGTIVEPDDFTLSPDFKYQGKALMYAAQKPLTFNGYVRIKQDCPNYADSWLKFESPIDPINVVIPIGDTLKEINGKFINLGTLITTDSIHIYSSFFGQRKNYSDSIITSAQGILRYVKDSTAYMVASPEKMKNPAVPGNLVSINRTTCNHHGEGTVNLGVHFGQFKIKSAGNTEHDLRKNEVRLRIMMELDFFMWDKSMEAMALLVDSLTGSKPTDITLPYFKENFGSFIEKDKLKRYYDELAKDGKVKELPDSFQKTMFLNDVNFIWDDVTNTYKSYGKIGIGYIFKRQINDYVNGYIEIARKRSGDQFDMYLQIDDKTYYYFAYTRGTMHVLSSDPNFIQPIKELKDDQRILKVSRGQMPYLFIISSERKKNMFYQRWKQQGQGIQEQEETEPEDNAAEPEKGTDEPDNKANEEQK